MSLRALIPKLLIFALLSCLCDSAVLAEGVEIVWAPRSGEQPLGGPVFVDFCVTNHLPRAIEFDLGPGSKMAFELEISTPAGVRHKRKLEIKEGIYMPGLVVVQPGDRYQQQLVINDWFELVEAGTYSARLRLTAPIRDDNGLALEVKKREALIVFTLVEDPERLRNICERLVRQATRLEARIALEAAHALGYVQHPICTPLLKECLLTTFHGRDSIARSLANIGTAEAVDALIAAWKKDRGKFQYAVGWALYDARDKIRDPEVKKRVAAFLKESGVGGT
ncbi:MAG: hypothetical protein HC897_02500 [Thermoanaerobaculia bacterium]|nr:hypothetical protein [Thermoanaerobaculia bacterium]